MKTSRGLVIACVLFLGVGLVLGLDLVFAQTELATQQLEKIPGLELVAPENVPSFGTFWSFQKMEGEFAEPPLPFLNPLLPKEAIAIYLLGDGQFLVDDRLVDYDALEKLAETEKAVLQATAESLGLKFDDEEGGGGGMMLMSMYGSNDLWLDITGVSNAPTSVTVNFFIHTPLTNGVFDLFATTNLNSDGPGLNMTNWFWLSRTEVGETNIVLTNLWPDVAFFRLGTLLDSDEDGLTDAYENLVSHTDPNNPDTDGDGVNDYLELLLGRNPLVSGAISDTGGITRLRVYTPLK